MTEHLLGTRRLPSGRLSVSDPVVALGRPEDGELVFAVGAGDFPVYVDIIDVAPPGQPPHLRNRRLSVLLAVDDPAELASQVSETVRPVPDNADPREVVEAADAGEHLGVGVDSAMVGFADAAAAATGMPVDEQERDELSDSWWPLTEDTSTTPRTCADIPLPQSDGANVILCMSGWGDGVYPVTGSVDAARTLLAVHIDFGVEPLP